MPYVPVPKDLTKVGPVDKPHSYGHSLVPEARKKTPNGVNLCSKSCV